jgi:hypothetical protein
VKYLEPLNSEITREPESHRPVSTVPVTQTSVPDKKPSFTSAKRLRLIISSLLLGGALILFTESPAIGGVATAILSFVVTAEALSEVRHRKPPIPQREDALIERRPEHAQWTAIVRSLVFFSLIPAAYLVTFLICFAVLLTFGFLVAALLGWLLFPIAAGVIPFFVLYALFRRMDTYLSAHYATVHSSTVWWIIFGLTTLIGISIAFMYEQFGVSLTHPALIASVLIGYPIVSTIIYAIAYGVLNTERSPTVQ